MLLADLYWKLLHDDNPDVQFVANVIFTSQTRRKRKLEGLHYLVQTCADVRCESFGFDVVANGEAYSLSDLADIY